MTAKSTKYIKHKKIPQSKINRDKIISGCASYDIWSENGVGIFSKEKTKEKYIIKDVYMSKKKGSKLQEAKGSDLMIM